MKKYLLGLFAIVLAVAFSAFTVQKTFNQTLGIVLEGSPVQNHTEFTEFDLYDEVAADEEGDCEAASAHCRIQVNPTDVIDRSSTGVPLSSDFDDYNYIILSKAGTNDAEQTVLVKMSAGAVGTPSPAFINFTTDDSKFVQP